MTVISEIRKRVSSRFRPPPRIRLSDWMESSIRLPDGVAAVPGPIRLMPFQRDIADAISDPTIERVTLLKSARIGYSTLLTAALGSYIANDPAPIILVLPALDDCRTFFVSSMEPIFNASSTLRGLVFEDKDGNKRSTMQQRRFAGGSLKIIPAKAPRNLRAHTARVLFLDEIDALTNTADGDPLALAEERTRTFPDRKIVIGSTPAAMSTSLIYAEFLKSDQRIFEACCPSCSDFREVLWDDIKFEDDAPEKAYWCAPCCGSVVEERHKATMVAKGRWRATKPEVKNHAGFKINSLVSPLANAAWGKLAQEWIEKRDVPEKRQTFVNNVLGLPWNDIVDDIDESQLLERVKPIGMGRIPEAVLYMTVGIDVQDNRLEAATLGWDRDGEMYVLDHRVIFGSPDDPDTWREADQMLNARHQHPLGGTIGIDAAAIDSGDGDWTQAVYDFTDPRANRRIMSVKGMAGSRGVLVKSTSKKARSLFIVGSDVVKNTVVNRVFRNSGIHFSDSLGLHWFEQLCSEHRVVDRARGRPVARWVRKKGRDAEALDAVVYAYAARQAVPSNFDQRAAELRKEQAVKTRPRGHDFQWPAAA